MDLTTQYSTELKQIETSVAELQARKQQQLSRKRRFTRILVLYGSIVWLMLMAALYLVDFPNRGHFVAKCLRIGPLVMWPIASAASRSQRSAAQLASEWSAHCSI